MNKLLVIFFESYSKHDIFIGPNEVHDLSDVDSGDENLDGTYYNVNNL